MPNLSGANLRRRQIKALAAHDVLGLPDGAIAVEWGLTRTAVTKRRSRGLAAMPKVLRDRYLRQFPPRLGRPRKRRRKLE